MKLFVKASFHIENPVEVDEIFSISTYGIGVVAENLRSEIEIVASMIAENLCPIESDFAEVEEYKELTDEQFILLQELLPVFNITGK